MGPEFQRIIDHRGQDPMTALYPMAFVEQARSYMLVGDTTKARKNYEVFLQLWKDADPNIPILQAAKAEYANLRPH